VKFIDEYRDARAARKLAAAIARVTTRPWNIMEVCGGQTHAIVKFGIDELLPPQITLVHGPGCPVCVTPVELIDKAVEIAALPEVIFCSFGDMLRVPGTHGDLLSAKARGADVRVVYSPLDALAVARANAGWVRPGGILEFRVGDLFDPVAGERFDVIVSNPPYIAEPEYATLDPSVRDFEPRQALVSGPDGLAHTRAILEGARHHLAPGGLLALEVDSRRAEQSAGLARVAGFQNVRVEPDVFERPRFLLVRKDRA